MSLLNKIRHINNSAADVLEQANCRTDSDIRSLTRADLHELFPGHKNLKLRRTIFELIQPRMAVDVLLREVKDFIPHEHFRAALTGDGVLVDYLHILKDMKSQMNNVQGFLDAHIGLLEEFSKDQPVQESNNDTSDPSKNPYGQAGDLPTRAQGESYRLPLGTLMTSLMSSVSGRGTSATSSPVMPSNNRADVDSPGSRSDSFTILSRDEVTYRILVSGKTFNADKRLMEKVIGQSQEVGFVESSEGHQITVLFCPISSRIGSDVEAAMSCVKDDKPVLLVLMHHVRQPKHTTAMSMWSPYPNIVLHVNVFYHETMYGLLTCDQNSDAIYKIRDKLLEYSTLKCQAAGDIAVGVSGESDRSGIACVAGFDENGDKSSGNNRGSDSVIGRKISNFFR